MAAAHNDPTARGVTPPEGRRAVAERASGTGAPGGGQSLATPAPVPGSEVVPAADRGSRPDDLSRNLVERRFAATRHWLASVDPNALTIQLMAAKHEPQLVPELNDMAKSVEPSKIF